jgi:hypothetical protein
MRDGSRCIECHRLYMQRYRAGEIAPRRRRLSALGKIAAGLNERPPA